jgi:glycosyltransferase involved in cell wall biosynthesis
MPADKPHVLIDGTKLADAHIDGIRRYLEELLKALDVQIARQRPDWSIRVTLDTQSSYSLREVVEALERSDAGSPLTMLDRQLDALRHSPSKIGQKVRRMKAKLERSVTKRWPQWLPRWPQRSEVPGSQRCGLIHLPLPNTHRLYDSHPAPMMVTVHDLSHLVCPEFQTAANVATLAHGLTGAIQRGASFLAVSESTKREMVQLLDVPDDQIQVVHEASDRTRFQPVSDTHTIQRIRQKYRLPNEPFVLTLCRLEPRKNLMAVVRACHQLFQTHTDLPFHLVIAGGGGWGNQADELAKLTSDRVHLTGAVADEDLAALYSSAAAFTCMSFYEGFCLPILEAMGCGCPVIHSNTSAMPEIAGNAGLSAAPTDVDRIASHIASVLRDSALSRRLKAAGLARANEFSWARAADETMQMYDSILERTVNAMPQSRLRTAA